MARLIFDLDGTLVHSAPTMAAAANAYLLEIGRPAQPVETVIGFVGHGMRKLVERLLIHTGGIPDTGLDPALGRYAEIYYADPLTGTEAYSGVHAALAGFHGAGHGLGVCTQKPNPPALTILRRLGFMPPITAFTGGDSLDVLKPDPRMFWHAADQLAEGPAAMVGDSMTDAQTAHAAGVPFFLYTRGYRHDAPEAMRPTAQFDDFAQLPALVADWLARRAA